MHDGVQRPNPYHVAVAQFEAAADRLHLDPGMRSILRMPKRELIVHFPVRMDDGRVRMLTGFRVQHNLNRRPAQRRIRVRPAVTLDAAKALALWTTWKLA